ncbi:MAG: RES family NAD+ phosphorylase [Chloroflexi bacterium]|nr:RES family NAD+ phosphorylase [Chloroflexota bacterium]
MAPSHPATRPRYPPTGNDWRLPILSVDAGVALFRLTRVRHASPDFFGKTKSFRFDAPDRSFGVCYLGTSLDCCFLEVFDPDPTHELHRSISECSLKQYYVAKVAVLRNLRLAYLADDGLARLGIDLRVTGGDSYRLSRSWAKAIHSHLAGVDGIFYPSRHHNALYSIALFDRAGDAVAFDVWGKLGDATVADLRVETSRILSRFHIDVVNDVC